MDITLKELTEALYKFDLHQESLSGVFEKIVKLFQMLAADSEKISPEKKEAWSTNCLEILQKMITLLEPRIKNVSISEELLVQAFDNPNYFNVDEWTRAQSAKEEIMESFQKLLSFFFDRPSFADNPSDTPIEKKHPPPKHPTKSDWMKS